MGHYFADSVADATRHIVQHAGERDLEIYFAVARYADRSSRKALNIQGIRALFLDVDCGEGKPYAGKEEALAAFLEFRRRASLPSPTLIVDSGGGLHVYWTLDRTLTREEWLPLGSGLKAACAAHGFQIDTAPTADPARILRPLGTFNHKRGRPVALLFERPQDVSVGDMRAALKSYMLHSIKATPRPSSNAVPVNDDLSAGNVRPPGPEYDAARIFERCGALKHILDTRGAECNEPLWKDALHVLAYAKDGSTFVHPVSDGHPDYNSYETDRKFQQRIEASGTVGPTLCATFEEHLPDKCRACAYRGSIKSPIVLGVPTDPLMPTGYRLNANGILQKFTPAEKEDEEDAWEAVCDYSFSEWVLTQSGGRKLLSTTARLGSSQHHIIIDNADLAEQRSTTKALHEHHLTLHDKEARALRGFMVSFIKLLESKSLARTAPDSFGWFETRGVRGFAVGSDIYWEDGSVTSSGKDLRNIDRDYAAMGTLEGWKAVAGALAEQNLPGLTAILASAFAAPLMPMLGAPGTVLAAVSEASGVGKTTAARIAQAVWGHPTQAMGYIDDTTNAAATVSATIRNLPYYWDELRGNEDRLADLVFKVSVGRDKRRLTSSARMTDPGSWQNLMIALTNNSLHEVMERQGKGEAGLARVFEYHLDPLPPEAVMPYSAFAAVGTNYGHAGRAYVQWLLPRYAQISKQVNGLHETLWGDVRDGGMGRFWQTTATVLLAGALLAKQAGLVSIDAVTLGRFLRECYDNMSGKRKYLAQTHVRTWRDLLSEFLAYNQQGVLVCDRLHAGGGVSIAVKNTPVRALVAQHATDDRVIRVSLPALQQHIHRTKRSWIKWCAEFENNAIGVRAKARFGAGTPYQQSMRVEVLDFADDGVDYEKVS